MSVRPDRPALSRDSGEAWDATITRGHPSRRSGTCGQSGPFPLFCLAPRGVCPASVLAVGAVSSYLAFSPLPPVAGGRYVFCDTFRGPGLRQRPPRFHAARCSEVSGLSSRPHPAEAEPTGDHSGRPEAWVAGIGVRRKGIGEAGVRDEGASWRKGGCAEGDFGFRLVA